MSVTGVDLGGAGATMCYVKGGAIDCVLNEASKRKSPSLVSFYQGQRYLGEPAAALEGSNYKNTVRELKRLIGRSWSEADAQREIANFPNASRFSQGPNDSILVEVNHGEEVLKLDVTSLLGMQLSGLKSMAERSLAENKGTAMAVRDTVLSVPTYFTDAQRRCVTDAARVAGLNPLRLLNESTAVALDYGMWKNARNVFDAEKRTLVAFVDVGYSDSWASVVAYVKGKLTVLATVSEPNLGGRDVDAALAHKFAADFSAKNKGMDPRKDAKAMIKLGKAAEKAKQTLTPVGVTKAEVSVEYLMNETDLRTMLTLDELEAIVQPLAKRVEDMFRRALDRAGVQPSELSAVEMVGGSSRMRQFKRAVATVLNSPDINKPPNFGVLTTLNADESCARGCSLMCAILSPQFRIAATFETIEFVPYPIELKWDPIPAVGGGAGAQASAPPAAADAGDAMEVDTGAGTGAKGPTVLSIYTLKDEIPKLRRVTFKRSEAFDIHAEYSASAELPADVRKKIATFNVSGMPKNGTGKISVTFAYSKSGTLTCSEAVYTETVEEEVSAPAPAPAPAAPAADGAAPQESAPAPAPAPAEKKKKVTRTDLVVKSTFYGAPTEDEVKAMTAREDALAANDKALRDRVNARNALEEFIYTCRDKLDGELKEFATDKEADEIRAKSKAEEDWLYGEDADQATIQVFQSRLAGLHHLFDKVANRFLEVEARASAATRLNDTIESFLRVVNGTEEAYAHLSEEMRAKVRAECNDAMTWLTNQQSAQADVPASKEPVLTAAMIDGVADKVRDVCRPIINTPKPKPPPVDPPKPADASGGAKADAGAKADDVEMKDAAQGQEAKGEKKSDDVDVD